MVARIEACSVNASIDTLGRLCDALDVDARFVAPPPFVAGSRLQRDAGHAPCTAYVQRRLESAGWFVAREVEVRDGRAHGWIDLLAYHPGSGVLLVIEIKTEIDDVGRIERTLTWYQRMAWQAARGLGWRPARLAAWVLVLASEANEERIRSNRVVLAAALPGRQPGLMAMSHQRGLAMIDPRSRRAEWLIRTRVDGRRTAAPYVDYADFVGAIRRRPG